MNILSFITIYIHSFFSSREVFAQDSYTLELPSFTQSQDPASFVNNFYLYVLGIAGTLAVIMIVYGAIKYIITGGNTASQKDARDIIVSSVWGIVLLAGAYLILSTINPSLVELKNPGLSHVSIPEGGNFSIPVNVVCEWDNKDTAAIEAATALRASGASFSSYDQCLNGYADVQSNLFDMESGKLPFVCASGCVTNANLCKPGGLTVEPGEEDNTYECTGTPVYISSTLLNVLLQAKERQKQYSQEEGVVSFLVDGAPFSLEKKKIPSYRISSLTGDNHASNSYHYKGRAADIVPLTDSASLTLEEKKAVWQWYKDTFFNIANSHGGSTQLFFDKNGQIYNSPSDVFLPNGTRIEGFHIHLAI